MSENILKDLFVQERYEEVIDSLKIIYSDLFIKMLNFKQYSSNTNFEELNYNELYMLVKQEYPRYNKELRYMSNASFNPDNTYLDVINKMLSVYTYMLDTYKEDYVEDIITGEEGEDYTEDEY